MTKTYGKIIYHEPDAYSEDYGADPWDLEAIVQ